MASVVVLLFTLVAAGQRAAGEAAIRIGIAADDSGQYCLALPGAALDAGAPVTVVTWPSSIYSSSRHIRTVAVVRAGQRRTRLGRIIFSPRSRFCTAARPASFPGRLAVRVVGREFRLRLSDRIREARVRSCTSSEGLHLTVWSGVPLKTRRLWHAYWYLGYDVEQNCRPADYVERANK